MDSERVHERNLNLANERSVNATEAINACLDGKMLSNKISLETITHPEQSKYSGLNADFYGDLLAGKKLTISDILNLSYFLTPFHVTKDISI